ncbi:MAG: peptidoglycan DD-metalloendopeptidase family protein [Chitinispirillaceae bacterium]
MKNVRFSRFCLLSLFSVSCLSASVPDIDFSLAWSPDSLRKDSLAEMERNEDFSSLFKDAHTSIDTTYAWSNFMINSGRFDITSLKSGDTLRIPLVNASQKRSYAHPFCNFIFSDFGQRRSGWHYGVDIDLKTGEPVKCAFDGIVRVVKYDRRGYGRVVVVRHHNGIETLYAHLSRVKVKPRQKIKAGELVGLGGSTGRSSGSHLHFEVRYFGEPLNPHDLIDFKKYSLKNDTLLLTGANFEYLRVLRQTVYHRIRKGDTLGAIARRYGTTISRLCRLNGINRGTILRIGRKLMVRKVKKGEKKLTLQMKKSSEVNQ